MINKYNEFLLEKLILESEVLFSDKFRKTLSAIDHPISKNILDIENKDIDTKFNLFDINLDKNDKITFFPDSKVQDLIPSEKNHEYIGPYGWLKHTDANDKIFNTLGYEPEGEPYRPRTGEVGREVGRTISSSTGRTYVYLEFENGEGVYNINKFSEDNNLKKLWNLEKGKQEVKVGKGIRSLLKSNGIEVSNKELEEFVNLFKSKIDKMNDIFSNFEIVKGDDIAYWYDYNNYSKETGVLGGSCMSSSPDYYFDIYTDNPETCNLVILKDPNNNTKIIGRSLLWTLIDGKKFLDRIYTNNDSDVNLFREYAKGNGWYYKRYNNHVGGNEAVSSDDEIVRLDLTVSVSSYSYDNYPYLDTLKYFNGIEKKLTYLRCEDCLLLECTEGGWICQICDNERSVRCEECHGDGSVTCGDCDGEGSIECEECQGEGCEECQGNGYLDCNECNGYGDVMCGECQGNGYVDCRECY